jgi:hypothetical protein
LEKLETLFVKLLWTNIVVSTNRRASRITDNIRPVQPGEEPQFTISHRGIDKIVISYKQMELTTVQIPKSRVASQIRQKTVRVPFQFRQGDHQVEEFQVMGYKRGELLASLTRRVYPSPITKDYLRLDGPYSVDMSAQMALFEQKMVLGSRIGNWEKRNGRLEFVYAATPVLDSTSSRITYMIYIQANRQMKVEIKGEFRREDDEILDAYISLPNGKLKNALKMLPNRENNRFEYTLGIKKGNWVCVISFTVNGFPSGFAAIDSVQFLETRGVKRKNPDEEEQPLEGNEEEVLVS